MRCRGCRRKRRACWSIRAARVFATIRFPPPSRRSNRSAPKRVTSSMPPKIPKSSPPRNSKAYKAIVFVSTHDGSEEAGVRMVHGRASRRAAGVPQGRQGRRRRCTPPAIRTITGGWYGKMIGGYFERHPKGTPKGVLTVVDAKHPATAKLPKTIERNDEWYYYKDFDPTMHVLVTVDPATIGDGRSRRESESGRVVPRLRRRARVLQRPRPHLRVV